ncbi:hypothetical protein SAMN04488009_0240, partial [Maribacter sedimenticola]
MKAIIFFFLIALFTVPTVTGQIKIGDNPQNIDPASVLELESSSKVLVITRVTTAEMDAILPQRGGIVYNTDAECIYYYDGVAWINLCDAVDFNITNDPIINNRSTIAITQSNAGYNLEVAKNSILGNNIVDGGIGAVDIADNSITQDKLAENSVGSSEIRENAVGSVELKERSIQAVNIAEHTPGHILITDENGIVVWQEADALKGAIADEFTITGDGTLENRLELSEGIQLNISNNTTLIADHIVADEDTDDTNELVDLSFDKLTNTLSISKSATPVGASVNLEALVGSDDQVLTLTADNKLQIENGNEVDLSILNNAGSDIQTISTDNTPGNIEISNGNELSINVNDADANPNNELQNIQEVLADGNNAGGLLLKNLGNPVDNQDAVTKAYVDGAVTGVGGAIVSTQPGNNISDNAGAFYDDPDNNPANEIQNIQEVLVDGNNAGGQLIKNIGTPVDNQDAATKAYVDANSGTNTLTDGTILVGFTGDVPTERFVAGDVEMNNIGEFTIVPEAITPAKIEPAPLLTPTQNQMLITNAAGVVVWSPVATTVGSTELADGTTIIGDGTATNRFSVNTIGSGQITDGSILLEDLNVNNAVNGQVIKWDANLNGGLGAWTVANDLTDGTGIPTLANGTMLIGSNTNLPIEVTISGDATIANSGILTIADDAITLNNLSDMGAGDGEVLKWNQTALAWEPAADVGGTTYSGGNGLTLNGTTFDVDNLQGEVTGPTTATVIANDAV